MDNKVTKKDFPYAIVSVIIQAVIWILVSTILNGVDGKGIPLGCVSCVSLILGLIALIKKQHKVIAVIGIIFSAVYICFVIMAHT